MLKSILQTLILTALAAIFCVTANAQAKEIAPKVPAKTNRRPAAAAVKGEPFDKATVAEMGGQCVELQTEAGIINLELFPESAPETVRNFLNLAKSGFFDTTTFSRVVPGFVIQGGDLSTGSRTWTAQLSERSRRTIPDEPSLILHQRGILSMARGDEPHSASTSFFILVADASYLNAKFSAFGRVTKGMEIVDAINKMPVEAEKPAKPVRVTKAIVAACPPPAAP